MSLARVKIEEDDDLVKIEEDGDKMHDGTGTGPSREESVAAQTAPAVNNDDRGASSLGTLTSNTLELTANQASHVRFPPGCCVMHMDPTSTPPAVAIGTIKSVAIDLGQSNALVYCITPQGSAEKQNVYYRESNLLWGPTCTVWVRPSHLTAEQPDMAAIIVGVVLGSVQVPDKVFYSVRDANDPSKVIHGIPQEAVVKYRPPENEAIAPAVSSDASVINPEASDETDVVEASETPHRNLPFAQRWTPPAQVTASKTPTHRSTPASLDDGDSRLVAKRLRLTPDSQQASKESVGKKASTSSVTSSEIGSSLVRKRARDQYAIAKLMPKEDETSQTYPTALSDETPTSHYSVTSIPTNIMLDLANSGSRILSMPSVVDVDRIRGVLLGNKGINHRRLEHATRCKFYVRGYPFQDVSKEGDPVYLKINGLEGYLDAAVKTLENAIVESFDPEEQARVLYHLAKANKTDETSSGVAALQRCSPGSKNKVWMAVHYNSKLSNASMGLFVGKGRVGLKGLMAITHCRIESKRHSTRPHLFVTGKSANDVNNAVRMIRERLKWARDNYMGGDGRDIET